MPQNDNARTGAGVVMGQVQARGSEGGAAPRDPWDVGPADADVGELTVVEPG